MERKLSVFARELVFLQEIFTSVVIKITKKFGYASMTIRIFTNITTSQIECSLQTECHSAMPPIDNLSEMAHNYHESIQLTRQFPLPLVQSCFFSSAAKPWNLVKSGIDGRRKPSGMVIVPLRQHAT